MKEGNDWSLGKTTLVSAVLFAVGYAVTYTGFSEAAANMQSTEAEMELFFTFCSPNVAIMTVAVFLLLQKVIIKNETVMKALANMTKCGFGIYMVHYFIVGPVFILMKHVTLPIPLQVPIMAVIIFCISWGFTWMMYRLLGERARWIMG